LASSTLSRSESKDPVARRAALAVPYLEMIARQVDVRDKAEDTIAQGVAAARLQGATWAQCGQALGITREGAFKRFGSQGPEALPRSLQGDRLDGPDSLA